MKESDIKDPEYFSMRGIEKYNENELEAAILDFDKAIALNDENPNYYNLRGHARFSIGDVKGAKSDFNKSKKLKTKGKKVRKNAQ